MAQHRLPTSRTGRRLALGGGVALAALLAAPAAAYAGDAPCPADDGSVVTNPNHGAGGTAGDEDGDGVALPGDDTTAPVTGSGSASGSTTVTVTAPSTGAATSGVLTAHVAL